MLMHFSNNDNITGATGWNTAGLNTYNASLLNNFTELILLYIISVIHIQNITLNFEM